MITILSIFDAQEYSYCYIVPGGNPSHLCYQTVSVYWYGSDLRVKVDTKMLHFNSSTANTTLRTLTDLSTHSYSFPCVRLITLHIHRYSYVTYNSLLSVPLPPHSSTSTPFSPLLPYGFTSTPFSPDGSTSIPFSPHTPIWLFIHSSPYPTWLYIHPFQFPYSHMALYPLIPFPHMALHPPLSVPLLPYGSSFSHPLTPHDSTPPLSVPLLPYGSSSSHPLTPTWLYIHPFQFPYSHMALHSLIPLPHITLHHPFQFPYSHMALHPLIPLPPHDSTSTLFSSLTPIWLFILSPPYPHMTLHHPFQFPYSHIALHPFIPLPPTWLYIHPFQSPYSHMVLPLLLSVPLLTHGVSSLLSVSLLTHGVSSLLLSVPLLLYAMLFS